MAELPQHQHWHALERPVLQSNPLAVASLKNCNKSEAKQSAQPSSDH